MMAGVGGLGSGGSKSALDAVRARATCHARGSTPQKGSWAQVSFSVLLVEE